MFEEEKTNIDNLVTHAEEYIKTQKELTELVIADKATDLLSNLFTTMLIGGILFLVIAFASIGAAHFISNYYGDAWLGFVAVAVFYLLVGIIFYVKRRQWIKQPMMNAMIKGIFNKE